MSVLEYFFDQNRTEIWFGPWPKPADKKQNTQTKPVNFLIHNVRIQYRNETNMQS